MSTPGFTSIHASTRASSQLTQPRDDGPDDPAGTGHWMAIDWAMKALSVAGRACEIAGLKDIAAEVVTLHTMAQRRRDGR